MKMSEFVSLFVSKWQDHIYKMEHKKCGASSDLLVTLEGRITAREINALNMTYLTSNTDVSEESLKPFIDFLAKRRARIYETDADYSPYLTANTDGNLLCEKLAQAIARRMLEKSNVSKQETAKYLTCGFVSNDTLMPEQKQQVLRQRVAACVKHLFENANELIQFMAVDIEKKDWQEFIKCCDLASLKDFFLPPAFIKKQGSIYNAVTKQLDDDSFYDTNDDKNDARLFCLLEIYKRQRDIDPNYLGIFGSWTGIRGGRRVSQLQRLQDFIVSGETNLDLYMKQFKADEKSLQSGHTKILANRTKKIRSNRVNRKLASISDHSDLPRPAAGM